MLFSNHDSSVLWVHIHYVFELIRVLSEVLHKLW